MNRIAVGVIVCAVAAVAAGLAVAPQRAWLNLLIAAFYVLGVGLAAAFFIALAYATGSGWSVALRRVPEALTSSIYAGVAGILVVLLFGAADVYVWMGDSELQGFKAWWLGYPFFLARAVAYAAVWMVLSRAIVRRSRAQDRDADPRRTAANIRLSALFIVAFALTFWLASHDWLMSLEPHFASTIFGVYQFAGMFQAGIAAVIVLGVWLDRRNASFRLRAEHLHDLGKLLFAFSTFWMYIWFSQYMLVWYANLPEEAGYLVARTRGAWGPLFMASMILNWCVPFAVLLPKKTKRNSTALATVAGVVLLGRWLDLYLCVMPVAAGNAPVFGPVEIAAAMLAGTAIFVLFRRAVKKADVVPVNDPFLKESLTYHA